MSANAAAKGGMGALLAVVIPGGIALGGGAAFARLYTAARTGVPYLDSFGFRSRLITAALRVFGPKAGTDLRYVRALMAIAHNEFDPHKGIGEQLGDESLAGGPSVGAFQVYRATAIDLGLWTPPANATDEQIRQAYAENARHPLRMAIWGATVFKDKLRLAKGDFADAIRRYNGSGEKAQAYESKAVAFASGDWGEEVFS